jgi:hypothetical protein
MEPESIPDFRPRLLHAHRQEPWALERKIAYNRECRAYCENHPERFSYIDPDMIVPPEHVQNASHLTRQGYFILAREIMTAFDAAASTTGPRRAASAGAAPLSTARMAEYRCAAEQFWYLSGQDLSAWLPCRYRSFTPFNVMACNCNYPVRATPALAVSGPIALFSSDFEILPLALRGSISGQ